MRYSTIQVDWSVLTEDLDVAARCADLEYCAFVTNDETSTQVCRSSQSPRQQPLVSLKMRQVRSLARHSKA